MSRAGLIGGLPAEAVGGAVVARAFRLGERRRFQGEHLSAAEVLAIPLANRRCLEEQGKIQLYPRGAGDAAERFVIHRGGGRFDVIEGRILNVEPMSREEADALAGNSGSAAAAA